MRTALVTGGSRGIGRAICIALAKEGNHIIINYKSNREEAEETLQNVISAGGTGELLPFNCGDKEDIENTLSHWQNQNPERFIEILVNNAGIRRDNVMVMMSDEEWYEVINIHLNGFFHVTRSVTRNMVSKRRGRIVNVVSLSGVQGMQGQVNYSAAKAGVIGATKALARELGRRNITVNAVAPGFIKTDMTEDIDESQYKAVIPAGRFGTADEVAAAVCFLASPSASYITGEVINVNGGLYT